VIAMNHLIAATRKPVITSIALPGRRLADKIRFVAGIAITSGGAFAIACGPTRLMAKASPRRWASR
jgi:hypothetical protein